MTKSVRLRPDIRLASAASHLAELARRIDEGEALTPVFLDIFSRAKTEHTATVANATTTADILCSLIAGAKHARDRWAAKAKALEDAREEMKLVAKAAMAESPDLPWTDFNGQKISICKNSQATLNLNLALADKSVRNIVDQVDAKRLAPYVKPVTYFVIDTDLLRTDLAAGKIVPWASLDRGSHVRGLNGSDRPDPTD